jgi:ubiquinone biosynthesis protein UbiJ
VEGNRPLEEVLEELRRVFSEREIDRLLRQATIRRAEGASADRDYLLQRVREFTSADWDAAQPILAEFLRVLAQLVASVETLWSSVARLEQRLDRLEEEIDGEEPS